MLWEAYLTDPSPDAVTFQLLATITVPKPFTVVLDKFNLGLFMRGVERETPYVYLQLPKYKLHGNATIKLEPQRAQILNQQLWLAFLKEYVYREKLKLAVKGKTTGRFGALKASLTLDKDVRLKGMHPPFSPSIVNH